MCFRLYLLVCFTVQFLSPVIYCQIPVGAWRDHLSWNTAEAVIIANEKVYCSNGVGLCVYDKPSRELDKLTKINGLHDAGITALGYATSVNSVIVGYANGNLDIINGSTIINIPDIKRNNVYPDKYIHHIFTSGQYAYVSCTFGIVVIDLALRQIRDTYIIGDDGNSVEVFAITIHEDHFYAATTRGIKRAAVSDPFLTNYTSWKRVEEVPGAANNFQHIVSSGKYLYTCDINGVINTYDGTIWKNLTLPFAPEKVYRLTTSTDHLIVSVSGAILIYDASNTLQTNINSYGSIPIVPYDATLDKDETCWIADNKQGLVQWKPTNTTSHHLLNGPSSNNIATLRYEADRLLVVSGGMDLNGKRLNRPGEIHTFYTNQWHSIQPQDAYDFTDIAVSVDTPDKYYVSSWGEGVFVFENGTLTNHYTSQNSTLTADYSGATYCGGLLMGENNELWVSNDKHASLFTAGQWKGMPWQSSFSMGRFSADNFQQIWTPLHNAGLWVFDKAASIQGQTDRTIRFTPYNDTQSQPIYRNNQVANTPDGIVWVATEKGPVYYNNPSKIIDGEDTKGFHPIRTGTDEISHLYALLGSENVLTVAIDGAYRKWFGTETGGVFLIAEDDTREVLHFTTDNSPLFSNKIYDIAINDKTGEVFFATEYGIIAYRSDAVSSGDDFGHVYVFPNPVRPDYNGTITITGLIKDADIKITDVAGNLVFQTRSMGGMAVWDGHNQKGRRVATGIYLVFCTNDDGSKTHITKLMFIH